MKKNFMLSVIVLLNVFYTNYTEAKKKIPIDSHGFWCGEDVSHKFDPSLANAIGQFLKNENCQTCVDFGCGNGKYTRKIMEYGIDCEAYDGNPDTAIVTKGLSKPLDLAEPFNLGKKFDWVVCLEVAEHIPRKFEAILLSNLKRHTKKGLVLSWARKGQGGYGHFNEQNNDYVKEKMKKLGFYNDEQAELILRKKATLGWFKNTVMIFRKK